jgi:SHS2 domain-containing protein
MLRQRGDDVYGGAARAYTDPMNEQAQAWLKYLDHTADEALEVRAAELPLLFARCAWGMFSLLTDMDTVRPVRAEDVVVEATDREALLVRWLSELNVRHQTRHVVFSRFEVAALTDERLTATVWGEPLDPRRHTIHAEIKAVTYHLLHIIRDEHGWTARVLFDV